VFPTTVLVGVDTSAAAARAVEVAAEICAATGSELHLLHVKIASGTLSSRPVSPTSQERLRDEGVATGAEIRRRVEERGVPVTATHVRAGSSIERALVHAQAELGAGLLVIGASTNASVGRRVLGSTPIDTVRRAAGSVLVVRP
jgi:nucleotide-binding universal stress UspA family protein